MTRAIPTSDSADAVDTSWLLMTLEPGTSPGTEEPVSQTIRDVVRAAIADSHFDTPLGASPAVLPAGTREIVGYISIAGRTDRHPFVFPVSVLPAVQADLAVDIKNAGNNVNTSDSLGLRVTYTAATRTLAYAVTPASAGNNPDNASIGAISARGFA